MSFSSPYSLPYNDTSGYPSSPFEKLAAKLAVGHQAKEFAALLSDLQANILSHHRKKFSRFYFIQFKNEEEHLRDAIKWIQEIADLNLITSAKKQFDNPKDSVCCFYLTWEGYRTLKLDHRAPALETHKAFEEGMKNRLGFLFPTKTDEHLYPKDDGVIHATLMVASDKPDFSNVNDKLKLATGEREDIGWAYVTIQDGLIKTKTFDFKKVEAGKVVIKPKKKFVEWFGFRDGVSQPLFFPDAQNNNKVKEFEIDSVAPLKIVLARDEGGQYEYSAGSFLAFLKLEQNVKLFRENVKKVQEKISEKDPNLAAAYIMGRFYDGTSVSHSRVEKKIESPKNDFDYLETYISNGKSKAMTDEKGIRCPFAAHARKANPRDEKQAIFIARRGVLYDDTVKNFSEDNTKLNEKESPEKEVGLLFMSFQSSLDNQFEYILNNWILSEKNGTQRFGIDMLTGDMSANPKFSIWHLPEEWSGEDPKNEIVFTSNEIKPCVRFKGGEYFFAPSISFLKRVEVNSFIPKKIKTKGGDTDEGLESADPQLTKDKGEKKGIAKSIEKEAVQGAFKIPDSFGKGKK